MRGQLCEVRLRVGEPGSEREVVVQVPDDAVDLPAEVQAFRGQVRGLWVRGGSKLPPCLVGLTGLQVLCLCWCFGLRQRRRAP